MADKEQCIRDFHDREERARHRRQESHDFWERDRQAKQRVYDRQLANARAKPTEKLTQAEAPVVTITAAVAATRYHVNAQTIGEAVRDGRLTDHRPPGHVQNAPHLLDEREVSQFWPRRAAPK